MEPVTVYVEAVNYEGAHFRGIASASDSRIVKFNLSGPEAAVVDFLLENFSYGPIARIHTLNKLGKSLAKGAVPLFDGCGGILMLKEGDKLLFNGEEFRIEGDPEPIDIGTIDLTTIPEGAYKGNIDFINHLLQKLAEQNKLPHRDGDPDHNIYESDVALARAAFPDQDVNETIDKVNKIGEVLKEMAEKNKRDQTRH